MEKYRKLIVAAVGAIAAVVGRHFGLDSEWYLDVVAIATALGVYAAPNG